MSSRFKLSFYFAFGKEIVMFLYDHVEVNLSNILSYIMHFLHILTKYIYFCYHSFVLVDHNIKHEKKYFKLYFD